MEIISAETPVRASMSVVRSVLKVWPGVTVISVTTGTEADVLEARLPMVEEAGSPEPEVGVTLGIAALLERLDSRAPVERGGEEASDVGISSALDEPKAPEDSLAAEASLAADEVAIAEADGTPDDSGAILEPDGSSPEEAGAPDDSEAMLEPDGRTSPEDAETEEAAGPVGAGVDTPADSEAAVEPDGTTSLNDDETPNADDSGSPDDVGTGKPVEADGSS